MRALQKFVVVLLGLGLSTAAWAVDADGDGWDDTLDNCPIDSNADQIDSDCDGEGDACQSADHSCITCCEAGGGVFDDDEDGIDNDHDNCVNGPNPGQEDSDCDGVGDPCDFVDDGFCGGDADAIPDADDNCPADDNPFQEDVDCDGIGDACDLDSENGACGDADGDLWANDDDNCPDDANTSQADSDCDDVGDACDGDPNNSICDVDNDLVADRLDNCPADWNPAPQDDLDCDLIGDACDDDPHDGLCGDHDYDGDGVPEALDVCPDDDASDHDLYLDGCVDTLYDFAPYIETLGITKRSAETALTAVADSAADSLEREVKTRVAELKLRALENLAKALNKVAFITNDQYGLIIRFSDDIDGDV